MCDRLDASGYAEKTPPTRIDVCLHSWTKFVALFDFQKVMNFGLVAANRWN